MLSSAAAGSPPKVNTSIGGSSCMIGTTASCFQYDRVDIQVALVNSNNALIRAKVGHVGQKEGKVDASRLTTVERPIMHVSSVSKSANDVRTISVAHDAVGIIRRLTLLICFRDGMYSPKALRIRNYKNEFDFVERQGSLSNKTRTDGRHHSRERTLSI